MKTFISLFALFLSLSLTAQTNTATWYINDTSGNGIQSSSNTASGSFSVAMGIGTTASGKYSTAMGVETTASGKRSTAMGEGTIASGDFSTAKGRNTIASGYNSTVMGLFAEASGDTSTAMGHQTEATGQFSIAMGDGTTASGDVSTAMGRNTEANGKYSVALGFGTESIGWYSTALGHRNEASGDSSVAMGFETKASGDNSTTVGFYTTAEDYLTFAIGVYNKTDENPNPDNFSYQNTAFVIGNGGYDNDGNFIGTPESYSNAFEVLFDGTTTIAGDLNVSSDARLKANIVSLGSTLSKLLQIDGKSYTMKKDESEKQKIGLLAQDIEKVFPELVSESHGIKSVNYQGLVPVLINALKEQDAMMKEQESRLSKQQSEIDELKTMLKTIIEKT